MHHLEEKYSFKKCTITWCILHIILSKTSKFAITLKNDAFVAKKVNTRLTKNFRAICALAERLLNSATLADQFLFPLPLTLTFSFDFFFPYRTSGSCEKRTPPVAALLSTLLLSTFIFYNHLHQSVCLYIKALVIHPEHILFRIESYNLVIL